MTRRHVLESVEEAPPDRLEQTGRMTALRHNRLPFIVAPGLRVVSGRCSVIAVHGDICQDGSVMTQGISWAFDVPPHGLRFGAAIAFMPASALLAFVNDNTASPGWPHVRLGQWARLESAKKAARKPPRILDFGCSERVRSCAVSRSGGRPIWVCTSD